MTVQLISANSVQQHNLNLICDVFGEKIIKIEETKTGSVVLTLETKQFHLYPQGQIQGYQKQFGFESQYCLTTVMLTFKDCFGDCTLELELI